MVHVVKLFKSVKHTKLIAAVKFVIRLIHYQLMQSNVVRRLINVNNIILLVAAANV